MFCCKFAGCVCRVFGLGRCLMVGRGGGICRVVGVVGLGVIFIWFEMLLAVVIVELSF